MENSLEYECANCGKTVTMKKNSPVPECCGRPMTIRKENLQGCTEPFNSESSGMGRADEPCDDDRRN